MTSKSEVFKFFGSGVPFYFSVYVVHLQRNKKEDFMTPQKNKNVIHQKYLMKITSNICRIIFSERDVLDLIGMNSQFLAIFLTKTHAIHLAQV